MGNIHVNYWIIRSVGILSGAILQQLDRILALVQNQCVQPECTCVDEIAWYHTFTFWNSLVRRRSLLHLAAHST